MDEIQLDRRRLRVDAAHVGRHTARPTRPGQVGGLVEAEVDPRAAHHEIPFGERDFSRQRGLARKDIDVQTVRLEGNGVPADPPENLRSSQRGGSK